MSARILIGALLTCLIGPLVHAQTCSNEADCLAEYAGATVDRDTPIDFQLAESALRKGCELRETGEACRILSYLIGRKVFEGSDKDAQRFERYGCEAGDRIACRFLANDRVNSKTWDATRGTQSQQIRQRLDDQCASGNDFVCRVLVRFISADDAQRYRNRCNSGETAFCALLGGFEYYPFYQPGPLAIQAEKTFRQECEAGEGLGCIFLADLIERGHGTDLTEDRLPHLQRACELNIAHGCDVSHLILGARQPRATQDVLDALLLKSCDLGNNQACLQMARNQRSDSDQARTHYAHTLREHCLIGDWRSCEEAASAFNSIRYEANLREKYDDVDQMLENYFQFANAIKGR